MDAKKLPNGINVSLAKKIWEGNSAAINEARRIMHRPGGGGFGDGYDGMYIIKPTNDRLSIIAIGANSDIKKGLSGVSNKYTDIIIDQINPEVGGLVFEKSLCRVSKPFSIGFGT